MASPDVQFGTTIGRYQVVRRLGAGGMAVVCLAHDPRLNRDVAIKILGHKLTDQPGYRTYLQREARAVARLNHPHVAQVYDVLEHQNQTCFVMEYVQGETLAERLQAGPLPLPEVLRLGAQMASAVAHAHAHGVLHCDLKPGNVFVTRAGAIKVVDFGLARPTADDGQGEAEIGASPTLVKNRAGTPAYMSPEHLLGIALDERADVFSLGVILSEMATGRRPEALPAAWLGSSSDGTTRELPVVGPDVPELLRSVLMRALAPRPQMRYQTALELQDALERVAAHNPPAAIVGSADADAAWKRRAEARTQPLRPRPAVTALVKPAAWVLGATGVILVLGVLNSAVFNDTLGRSGFVTEGIGDWFRWGLKSVVAPGVIAAMLVILFEFARPVWRLVCRRWMPGVPSSITRALGRVGFEDPAFSARTLAGAGLVALGAVVWRFHGFLGALVWPEGINGGDLSRFAVLGSDHLDVHRQYRVTLTIVVVGLAVGLYGVLQRRRRLGARGERSTVFAAAAVFGLALAMLDLPYRVVHPTGSQFELAQLGSRSCYIIAERPDDSLVFCPEAPVPRNRIVRRGAPDFVRLGCFGRVFDTPRPC
jgi:hypothetical protein